MIRGLALSSSLVEWGSFAVVAATSLLGACVIVTCAALGLRLLDTAIRHRKASRNLSGRLYFSLAIIAFAACAAVVLFGLYLIIAPLHG